MKIDNFKMTDVKGVNALDWEFFATIDEKPLWGKKKTRQIRKEFAGFWHYVDTGKFTPGLTVNTLERAWEAQNGSIKKFKAQ